MQQFAHASDPSVAQVVDVVHAAQTVFEIKVVTHGGYDVFPGDVFRRQHVHAVFNCLINAFLVAAVFQNFVEFRKVGEFQHAQFLRVDVGEIRRIFGEIIFKVHHVVADDLDLARIGRNINDVDAGMLYFIRLIRVEFVAGARDYAAESLNVFRQGVPLDSVGEGKFFVEFVSADAREVIAPRVKQQIVELFFDGFVGRHFARAKSLVQLDETFPFALGHVLFQSFFQIFVMAESGDDFIVRAETDGTQKYRGRQFPGSVHGDPKHAVGVGYEFQPRAPVRNDGGVEHFFIAEFVLFFGGVHARRAHKLADHDALGAVYNKGAVVRHEREIAHKHFLILDFTCIFTQQAHFYFERAGVSGVSLAALGFGILGLFVERMFEKIQLEMSAVILYR